MRSTTRSLTLSLGLLLAASVAQAAGTAQVSYVQPERFADAGDAYRDQEGNLRTLSRHLEALAGRHLGDGQTLRIEVLDVDLAGEVRPVRRLHQDVRVLKGSVDWPRIKLRYTLETAGQAPRQGEMTVADLAYLQRVNRYPDNESLRYEKRMLDEWFSEQFAAGSAR